jgi:hypothetical protein
MKIDVTAEAAGVLRRSLELAAAGRPAGIRLRAANRLRADAEIGVELADVPVDDERVVTSAGITFFVEPAVESALPDALVTLEPPHDHVVVRPR